MFVAKKRLQCRSPHASYTGMARCMMLVCVSHTGYVAFLPRDADGDRRALGGMSRAALRVPAVPEYRTTRA